MWISLCLTVCDRKSCGNKKLSNTCIPKPVLYVSITDRGFMLQSLLFTRKHLSKIYRTSIENLSEIYRASIDNLSNIYRKSIETLSNIYRTSIEPRSPQIHGGSGSRLAGNQIMMATGSPVAVQIHPRSAPDRPHIYRKSMEHLSSIFRQSIEHAFKIYRKPIEHLWKI